MKRLRSSEKAFICWVIASMFVLIWTEVDMRKLQKGDLNLDGQVDVKDLSIMSAQFYEVNK